MYSPVLVLEDSPEDFEVLERAFKKAQFTAPLIHYKNAKEALEYLNSQEETSPLSISPSIIILDLNMPGMDGFSFLEAIKSNKKYGMVPIVVLSTSNSETDVEKSYKLGANSYVPKPEDMDGYVKMAEALKSYWFSFSLLPSKNSKK